MAIGGRARLTSSAGGPRIPLWRSKCQGKNQGTLPETSSFVAVAPSNVECTTLKPAEVNGAGFILRLVETQGRQTDARIALPLLAPLASATAVNLVEDDRPESLAIDKENQIVLKLPPYGVKTIRVLRQSPAPAAPADLAAKALSDMEVALSWIASAAKDTLSHYHVYRGTKPDFKPTLLNLVQRPAAESCQDGPHLYYGGWINNRLEPATTYYYRVAAVDRWNREGPASPAVPATTLKSSEKHAPPLEVRAPHGSACQPDLPLQRRESPLAHELRVRHPRLRSPPLNRRRV